MGCEMAERDALVPDRYKKLPVGRFEVPASSEEWKKRRPDVLAKVVASLGDLPPRPEKPSARLVCREVRPGYVVEGLAIPNGLGEEMTALLSYQRAYEAAARIIAVSDSMLDTLINGIGR